MKIDFGNVENSMMFFSMWAFIALTLGFIIYYLLAYPHARRQQFQGGRAFSKPFSVICGGAVALVLLLYSYNNCWSGFYSVSVAEKEIKLHYFYPSEVFTIPKEAIVKISHSVSLTKGGSRYSLIVQTKEARYHSAGMVKGRFFKQKQRLLQLLEEEQ